MTESLTIFFATLALFIWVMQDEASNEGGWFEWTPGQERPAPSNAGIHRPRSGPVE